MHPLSTIGKIATEAVRAATPQGSMPNQVASCIKQGLTLLDSLTADTPAKQAQTLAALLAEVLYANSNSEKERIALTIGNAFLLVLEGAQYAQTFVQPAYNGELPASPQLVQSIQTQSASFSNEFERIVRERQEILHRVEAGLQGEHLRVQQQLEEARTHNAEQDRKIAELKRQLGIS